MIIKNIYDQFINISKLEPYYHIYINEDKKEVKENTIESFEIVSKIKIKIDYEIDSLNSLFRNCKCIQKVNFIKCPRKDIKNIGAMFYGCELLEEVDFSNLITNNVTHMNCFSNVHH